jgi:hypothetical protein
LQSKSNLRIFHPARQCLSICCSRSHDAASRLGTTPVGLLPLACSSTGTGIRARIFALQLLTIACDKNYLGDHVPKLGHQAVSESLSTLRLRCAEPVRFRLMIGILNSGGGSGELQYVGMRFINTLMESAENLQTRLYLQAELFAAGLEPLQMAKLISSTSPWHSKLLSEITRWDSIKIDIEALQREVRNAEKCRSKLVILERKVEMLQEEKNVFTSIERRLQEKCAELQRELILLKKNASSTLEKRPIALPRQTISGNVMKKNTSEDEGISSSETGLSSSPIPCDFSKTNKSVENFDDDTNTTIDEVIEELENIVNDAQRDIMKATDRKDIDGLQPASIETEIVVNLLPQPPKKSNKSLIHVSGPQNYTEGEGTDYDLYYVENEQHQKQQFHSEYELNKYNMKQPDIINTTQQRSRDDNRQLLNVIMDARDKEDEANAYISQVHEHDVSHQKFNGGVFFMSDLMNHPSKVSKPDIMTTIQTKRVTKICGMESVIDVVMAEQNNSHQLPAKSRQIFLPSSPPQNFAFNNFKFKNTNVNPALFDQSNGKENRTKSGSVSKVTDLISGLY